MVGHRAYSFPIIGWVIMLQLGLKMHILVGSRHFLAVSAFSPLFRQRTTFRYAGSGFKVCYYSSAREAASKEHVPVEMKRALCDDILPLISDLQSNMTIVLLAGISGGCDSVALFHSLQHVRGTNASTLESDSAFPWSWTFDARPDISVTFLLHAIHFDHQQRGERSNADRELVENLCRQYNVPCKSIFWEDDYSSEDIHFSQEKARNWRRSHMRRHLRNLVEEAKTKITRSSNITGFMLSAHHLDDSNETLLLKLIRGSHLTKLTGMTVLAADEIEADLYWARPLLALSKNQLVEFLQENGYQWREDESNQKDVYLRNRVRNELVPLMKELMGGETAFQKRLDSLEKQSRKLRMDLSARAVSYLQDNTNNDAACSSRTVFSIPKDIARCDLVFEEALHNWVSSQIGARSCYSGYGVTYGQFHRLIRQIIEYPHRRKWTLNIGGGWDIQREGDILRILESGSLSRPSGCQHSAHPLEAITKLPEHLESNSSYIQIQLPVNTFSERIVFVCSRSVDCKGLEITPTWRQGRSPLKLNEFLRGQKVPLHDRGYSPVILMHNESSSAQDLVAVFVAAKGKWIVDAKYDPDASSDDKDITDRVWLRIPKWIEERTAYYDYEEVQQ